MNRNEKYSPTLLRTTLGMQAILVNSVTKFNTLHKEHLIEIWWKKESVRYYISTNSFYYLNGLAYFTKKRHFKTVV